MKKGLLRSRKQVTPVWAQVVLSFALPLFILTRFSNEDSLGPLYAFLLALLFPILLEVFGFIRYRTISSVSLLAIGGILITGLIGLLGLSEGWLAARRAAPYAIGGIVIIGSVYIKRPVLDAILPNIIDMDRIAMAGRRLGTTAKIRQTLVRANLWAGGLLCILAIASYISTIVVINSAPNTSEFNQEYAQLRLIGLLVITLPFLAGVTGLLFFIVSSLEKLTGLDFEDILKKK
jgi:hypothetical protein